MARSGRVRRAAVLAAAVAGLVGLAPVVHGDVLDGLERERQRLLDDVVVEQADLCSPDDLPEVGLQGDVPKADQASGRAKQGYNCGLSLVGHTPIWQDPSAAEPAPRGGGISVSGQLSGSGTFNANMAWAGDCAYVAGGGEAAPKRLSQFGLEINRRENCLAQLESGVDASSHYHDVDDADDSHFAMVSMWNAGVRVFDIRQPEAPVEVAYFNPADVGVDGTVLDQAWGHVRWVPETGQMWFATAVGGFWVVEMAPRVRDHLGLDDTPAGGWQPGDGKPPWAGPVRPAGHPGTAGAQRTAVPALRADLAPAWCTLGPLAS